MLYSMHDRDVQEEVVALVGGERAGKWGRPDLTANPYLSLWDQASMLYAVEPETLHADAAGQELLARIAEDGLWPLMRRVERDTRALNETAMRVDIVDHHLVFRPIAPDHAEATATRRQPGVPITFRQWHLDSVYGWVRIEAGIDGGAYFTASAEVDGQDRDVSQDILGGAYTGDAYPYRDQAGTAVLPFELRHSTETASLWDPYTFAEVYYGSLKLGVYLTMFGHVLLRASWPQRYAVGVLIEGADIEGGGSPTKQLDMDPAMLLQMSVREGSQPMVGQWAAGGDPEIILRAILSYERRLLRMAGLDAPDVSRGSASVSSGYSLAVSRESVREKQRQSTPTFRRADLRLIRLCAVMLNSIEGTSYPEDGYQIRYRGLPPSIAEDRAKLDTATELVKLAIITPAEAREQLQGVISRLSAA
jgi:hypothetical protein